MKRYAARRDRNERAIIDALETAGASVQQLAGDGLPDLLVSFADVLHLVEVKDHNHDIATQAPLRGKGNRLHGAMAALTPEQLRWWAHWKGRPPVIVTNAQEALKAIGASR